MDSANGKNFSYSFSTENNEIIFVRNAVESDAELIYDLSNEDIVRENSINQNTIDWEDHLNWLTKKLKDDNCFFLLGFNSEHSFIGQVRIDISGTESTIGISITKEFRGMGLSTYLLINTAKIFFEKFKTINHITAKIKKNNEPSLSTFIKAGYIFSHKEEINNNEFLVFKLEKNNEV